MENIYHKFTLLLNNISNNVPQMLSNRTLSSCINKRNVLKAHVVTPNKKQKIILTKVITVLQKPTAYERADWCIMGIKERAGSWRISIWTSALSSTAVSWCSFPQRVRVHVGFVSTLKSHARQCGPSLVKKGGGTALCWGVVSLTRPVPWPLPWSLLICFVVSLFLSQLRPWSLLEGSTALQSSLMTAPLKRTEKL